MKGFFALCAVCCLLVGCQTSNFAKSKTPATIALDSYRHSPTTWGGVEIFGIRNIEFGYDRGLASHQPIVVDPGPAKMAVWYYAHSGFNSMFDQTDPVILTADLAPNGHYMVRVAISDTNARFDLIDTQTNQVVDSSADVPVVIRGSPKVAGTPGVVPVPVIIPAHR